MSRKFDKNRSVDYKYHEIPLKYTGIRHPNNNNKELVLVDDYGKHYIAAYRNEKTNKVGIHFLLKKVISKGKYGFIFKDKFYSVKDKSGWVW